MKFTPSSIALRRTAIASVRFFGGPQIPSPVRRMAPKPRRCTEASRPSGTLPAKLADTCFAFMISSKTLIHFRCGKSCVWYGVGYNAKPLRQEGIFLPRSEEHTSELQSQSNLVCRLLLEKKNKQ